MKVKRIDFIKSIRKKIEGDNSNKGSIEPVKSKRLDTLFSSSPDKYSGLTNSDFQAKSRLNTSPNESLIISRRETYPDLTKSSVDKFLDVQAD